LDLRGYDIFLKDKVEMARSQMRANQGTSNEQIEAEFAARRAKADARPERLGPYTPD
jgi:hypothetical protein